MQTVFIQRIRTLCPPKDRAQDRIGAPRRRDHDPLAFARGLMNAFALTMLIWIVIALGFVWLD